MEICILGVSHQTTPVEIRERLAFSNQRLTDALLGIKALPEVNEDLIISTCNRTEIVAVIKKEGSGLERIRSFVLEFQGIEEGNLPDGFYVYKGRDAVEHLFRVASSLESMVVGEPQILGQVKDAFQCAQQAGVLGTILNSLFTQAIRVAKKVRTDTGIAKNAVSVSFAAVELARKIFGDISDKTILLIGAGEMSELAAKHLITNGVKNLIVANRTWERAQALAKEFNGEAVLFARILDILDRADIIITSTGAPHYILNKGHIHQAMRRRKNRPIFLIDIALPRDIDPEVNRYDNVFLYDIDDLQNVIDANIKEREKEAKRASEIISKEVDQFIKGCEMMAVMPTIAQLRSFMEGIRKRELERALSEIPNIENGQREVLDAMTSAIIKKILHRPIVRLKTEEDADALKSLIRATEELFNLDKI